MYKLVQYLWSRKNGTRAIKTIIGSAPYPVCKNRKTTEEGFTKRPFFYKIEKV